jgi:DNA polymerase-3 subunit beta
MQFKINQSDFLGVLQSVSRSCGVRSQLPVLGNVLLSAKNHKLSLAATNLEIGVIKTLDAEIVEEGELTVPARMLADIVSNLSGATLEIGTGSDLLKISTPQFSAEMNGIPASEFPVIPMGDSEGLMLDPKVLAESLPEVVFAAAVDEGRPVLTGILTQISGGKLQLVATDGYRLAHKELEVDKSQSFKALIPKRTFEEIVRLLSEDDVEQVKISISGSQNQIVFEFGNTVLSSRLIEGQFPAWEKIIPTEIKAKIIASKSELLKAVKLSAVFAKSEANVVKMQNMADKITLSSEAKELGGQKNEVSVEGSGEEMTVAFNAKYLLDALNALHTPKLQIELSGSLQAAMVKPVGEDGLRYIIMPINLS